MMLVANDQNALRTTQQLKCVLKTAYRAPGGAHVQPQVMEFLVGPSGLVHMAPRDVAEVSRPLIHNLRTRRDHHDAVDETLLDQRSSDGARCKGLACARSGVEEKVTICSGF